MLGLILATVLSAGSNSCELGSVCATSTFPGQPATVTITLSLSLEPAKLATIDVQPLDEAVAGFYRMNTEYLQTGTPDAGTTVASYLIVDDFGILKDQPIQLAFLDQVEVDVPLFVLALKWPEGMTDKEVLAYYNIDIGNRNVALAGLK